MNPSRVQVTSAGWSIDGKRRILLCASLFYFRVPPELWQDRIERVVQGGYDALDVYIPWNFHEPERGEYRFEGDRDVRRFLRLAREAGLYVVARPGPYICSEWDGGALPAWLYPKLSRPVQDPHTGAVFHSGHETLRQADEAYLTEVARWYDAVLPIVAEEQFDAGGAVIAVQIDNELDFYPCKDPKAYLTFLREKARSHGITVPLLACSGEDGVSAATGDLDDVVPTANVYSRYRSPHLEERVRSIAAQLEKRGAPLSITETDRNHFTLRRLLSAGARFIGPYLQVSGHHTGYFAGQNNWGKPSTFLQTDYDFGGMVGPDGELREEFYEGRLLAGFIESFEPELTGCRSETAEVAVRWGTAGEKRAAASHQLGDGGERREVYILSNDAGARFTFLANLEDEPMEVVAPQRTIVPPHRVAILPEKIDLTSRGVPATLISSNAEVSGVHPLGQGCLVVVAIEDDGEAARLTFETAAPVAIENVAERVDVDVAEKEAGTARRIDVTLRRGEAAAGRRAGSEARKSAREAGRAACTELSHALLDVAGRRLLLAFAPRRLASRLWKLSREILEGGDVNAPAFEMGWDWVSPSGERHLHVDHPISDGPTQRLDVFRIDSDGRIEPLDQEAIRRCTRNSALPAVAAQAYRRVEERDPVSLLQGLEADHRWSGATRYLEELGIHYGAAYYAFTVSISDPHELKRGLWIAGASDAVSFYINGDYLGTALPRGRSVALVGPLPWRVGENRVVVRTEILGHSNFHDTTVPVTHLGSMRGLAPPVVLSAAAPGASEYAAHRDSAKFPSPDPAFLYGLPKPPGLEVQGEWEVWRASRVDGRSEPGSEPKAATEFAEAFPCPVPAGGLVEVEVPIPAAGGSLPLWAKLGGRGIRGELWLAGRLVGRFWLEEREDLLFTGGRWVDRIWLPSPWCDGGVLTIRLFGAGKEGGLLEGVDWLYAMGGRSADSMDQAAAG